jgi:M6 family metalloprotease-like protein
MSVRRWLVATAVLVAASIGAATASAQSPVLDPVDPQSWVDQGELTWADYLPVPDERPEFYDTDTDGSQNQYRTAIILIDYPDQPFLVTQPSGSHPFGNPQPGWTPVAPEDVAEWFYDYYAVPNEYNGGRTLHGYWMEDTHGRIGVDVEVFGPYTMAAKSFEYGLATDFNGPVGSQANSSCPAGHTCSRNIRTDGLAAWLADTGCASLSSCGYNNGFYVTAGHDESSTWQEFGEMLWSDRTEVPAEFGPPGATSGPVLNAAGNPIPNWAPTRYVPWTSWRAAANHWPNAGGGTSTQAESSGQSVFAHEFSHLRGLPDNYNNPFADNVRNYTGYWEMMSRGTFNGPGGTHNRWQIPNAGGSALGPHHMLHFKNQLNALEAGDQVVVERNDLHTQGVAVVTVKARESVPDGSPVGLTVDFGAGGDLAGSCANQGLEPFYCPGTNYLHYRFEVVDRVGNDSFAPGHGVLLSKSRNSGTPRVWLIDPNPEDIGMIDFYRPDGTPVAVVRGDPRQLNDSTFHAGTGSGSQYEYVDGFNRLHFYFIDKHRDANGVLYYDIGVRRFDGAGDFVRGVALGDAVKTTSEPGAVVSCSFPLTNTGAAGAGVFDSDIYRISASSSSGDWDVTLPNALAAATAGETVGVEVHATRTAGSEGTTLSLTATSESDPTKTATSTCDVAAGDGDSVHRRVTANGPIVIDSSIGTYAADEGTQLYSGIDVRSTQVDGGDGPIGALAFEFTSGGRSYRLESEDVELVRAGLGGENDRTCRGTPPDPLPALWCTGTAEIRATARLVDDTKKKPVVVLDGLSLVISLTDRRAPGGQDTIAVTAWDGNKQVFSSAWAGFGPLEQALAGGSTRVL